MTCVTRGATRRDSFTRTQFGRVLWDVASVDEGALGFESVGIVAATAGVLDQAEVPILYLSTL